MHYINLQTNGILTIDTAPDMIYRLTLGWHERAEVLRRAVDQTSELARDGSGNRLCPGVANAANQIEAASKAAVYTKFLNTTIKQIAAIP